MQTLLQLEVVINLHQEVVELQQPKCDLVLLPLAAVQTDRTQVELEQIPHIEELILSQQVHQAQVPDEVVQRQGKAHLPDLQQHAATALSVLLIPELQPETIIQGLIHLPEQINLIEVPLHKGHVRITILGLIHHREVVIGVVILLLGLLTVQVEEAILQVEAIVLQAGVVIHQVEVADLQAGVAILQAEAALHQGVLHQQAPEEDNRTKE